MKQFTITPAIEWLESEENEHQRYATDITLISFKDDSCSCEEDDECEFSLGFPGLWIREVIPGGLELHSHDYMRGFHEEYSPQLKYLGIAQ